MCRKNSIDNLGLSIGGSYVSGDGLRIHYNLYKDLYPCYKTFIECKIYCVSNSLLNHGDSNDFWGTRNKYVL